MVHDLSALSWIAWTMDKYDGLPVAIIFAFGWLPYFAMAIWAFLKSNPPKSDAAP